MENNDIKVVDIDVNSKYNFDLTPFPVDDEKEKQSRSKYGIAISDTFGFDNYILVVLANGLDILAKSAHGHPQSFPDYESWTASLRHASNNARWCLDTYHTEVMELFKEYWGDLLDKHDGDLEGFLNDKLDPDRDLEYRTKHKKLETERQKRKDELMDFVKENFFALWD